MNHKTNRTTDKYIYEIAAYFDKDKDPYTVILTTKEAAEKKMGQLISECKVQECEFYGVIHKLSLNGETYEPIAAEIFNNWGKEMELSMTNRGKTRRKIFNVGITRIPGCKTVSQ